MHGWELFLWPPQQMSSPSFAEGKEALLGGEARGGGRTGRGEGGAGGADIEAPEMGALMDDIIVPPHSSSSDSVPSRADGYNNTFGDDGTISRTSVKSPTVASQSAASPAATSPKPASTAGSPASSRSSRSTSSGRKQRKTTSSRTGSSDGSSGRTAADWEEEELGGTVVGKAGRRRSSGSRRRRSSDRSGRRRSSGLLDRCVVVAARLSDTFVLIRRLVG